MPAIGLVGGSLYQYFIVRKRYNLVHLQARVCLILYVDATVDSLPSVGIENFFLTAEMIQNFHIIHTLKCLHVKNVKLSSGRSVYSAGHSNEMQKYCASSDRCLRNLYENKMCILIL